MVLPENYTQYFRLASSMARKYRKVADSFPVSQPTEITQEMSIENNTKAARHIRFTENTLFPSLKASRPIIGRRLFSN